MTAATGAAVSTLARTWSIGPVKIQVFNLAFVSGDTTAVCTGDRMRSAYWGFVTGVTQTAAPTFSGAAATFTFTDPAASIYGQAIVFGV
jgi:hypothetical protein